MNAKQYEEGSEETQIKMTLKGKTKKMFDRLKEYYNLGYNAELVRLLIKRDFDRIEQG
ncbi:MAG: hypothetical protein ACFFG0_15365 [Candidatus Thorarchaeota archaeon]